MQVILCTAEIDMADSVKPSVLDVFLSYKNMSHFTLPTTQYLKASPDTAIIGRDMLVDIPFIADWKKIGEHRQPTNRNTDREKESRIDYDNKVVKKYSYGTMVSSANQSPGI